MKKNPKTILLSLLILALITLGIYLIYNYLRMSADIVTPINTSDYNY